MKHKKIVGVAIVLLYAVIASIMCVPLAIASHEGLSLIGIESNLVELEVIGVNSYCHIAVEINNTIYEPRYLGLYKQTNINYEPTIVYSSSNELLNKHSFLPPISLLIEAIPEMIK